MIVTTQPLITGVLTILVDGQANPRYQIRNSSLGTGRLNTRAYGVFDLVGQKFISKPGSLPYAKGCAALLPTLQQEMSK